MTLEDFFTLTEMKDGLTAPARVKELVNAMQKEKDCIVKNVGDATRQWSTVASTIAATEDKDCLDLFIQLDGLWFIDRWLKDAQKFGNDTSDSFVEESITALLRALEKLHIDYEKSMSYGIWLTVENLLGHSSAMVQDRARALFGSWKQCSDGETVPHDDEKIGASCTDESKGSADLAREGGRIECSGGGIARSEEIVNEEKHVEPVRDEMMPSICSDVFHQQKVDDVQNQTSEKETNLDHEVTRPVKENLFTKEESVVCQSEGAASIDNCTSAVPKQGPEEKSNVSELNEFTDKAKHVQVTTGPPNKLGEMEIPSVSSLVEPRSILGDTAAANAQESVTEPDLPNDTDTNEKNPPKDSPSGDEADMSEGKSGMDDDGSPHYSRSMAVFPNQGHDCDANASVESSGNEGKLQELEDSDTSLSSEDSGAIDRFKGHATDESEDLANNSHFLKKAMNTKASDVVDKRSNLDLDYMVDPLEVALQVAIEVERQVVDRGEPSCSSSEKMSEGGIRQPGSPESIYGKEIQPIEDASKKVPSGPNLSTEALPKEEELLSCTKTLDAEAENRIKGTESSKVTEAAQEPDVNTKKGLGDFDLNKEVCSEDMDRTVNPHSTTPISVVSASRAAAAPGLPVAPLQFEGAHGWKGSAATSAFRPASPRRFLESEKILTIGGIHHSSKKRQDRLDFDLNVAVEHSVEASPRRSERLNLDLNRISDEGDAPSDWKVEGRLFHPGNGHCSSSPSSSSSSMQPSLRNFDLNNQPSFYNDSSDLLPILGKPTLQNLNARGGFKVDDSAISIMGTRVEVNRKDFFPQTPSLPNGRILEPTLDVNLASGGVLGMGSSLPYPHPPVFGYNGFTTGSTVPFSPAMYGPAGPIPYMVDSRGAPVVPQILGSASASPAAYSQPSFVMNMLGTHPGLNGAGNSQFNFDLNSGLMIEGGNRESGGLRQFFNPAHSRSADEHLWANSQPSSSSGGGGKRKEPDGGWEPYPFNYKHHQPPWK